MSYTTKQTESVEQHLLKLLRVMLNKHFATAADEYNEGISDRLLYKHAAEFREAEAAFVSALRDSIVSK